MPCKISPRAKIAAASDIIAGVALLSRVERRGAPRQVSGKAEFRFTVLGWAMVVLTLGTLIFNAYTERKVVNPETTLAEMMDVCADPPLVFHSGKSWRTQWPRLDASCRRDKQRRSDAFI
jgi:hypothetical protein